MAVDSSWLFSGPSLPNFFGQLFGAAIGDQVTAVATGTAPTTGSATALVVVVATGTAPTSTAGTATAKIIVFGTAAGPTATAATAITKIIVFGTAAGPTATAATATTKIIVFGTATGTALTGGTSSSTIVAIGSVAPTTVGGAGGRNWREFVSSLPPQIHPQPYKKTKPEKIKVSVLVWDENGDCSLVEMTDDEYLAYLI